jgi:hypothetical protein
MWMYCGENLTSAKKRFIVFVCRLKYNERDMYIFVFIITPPGALQKSKIKRKEKHWKPKVYYVYYPFQFFIEQQYLKQLKKNKTSESDSKLLDKAFYILKLINSHS